jgi:hypothetical protein
MPRVLSISAVLAVVLLTVPFRLAYSAPHGDASAHDARRVRLEWRDGTSTIVRWEGIGCSESICTRLTHVAAIRAICDDSALFVLHDGTERRVPIGRDNRVLYVTTSDGHAQKIEVQRLRSIDFDVNDAK